MYIVKFYLLFTIAAALPMRKIRHRQKQKYYPRDPSRCWLVSYWFDWGSVCSDPECLKIPCPRWPPIDPVTGIRDKPNIDGIKSVMNMWSHLQTYLESISPTTTKTLPPPKSSWSSQIRLKMDILCLCAIFLGFATLLCIIPKLVNAICGCKSYCSQTVKQSNSQNRTIVSEILDDIVSKVVS